MGIASGRTVPDETGGGNDLILQGTGHELDLAGAVQADLDGAIGFDGVAAFAIATDPRALDFANGANFTLECWARREAGGAEYFQHLLSNTEGFPGARNGYMLYLLPEPSAQDYAHSAFEYDSLVAEVGTYGPLPTESVWAHYVATFDGSTVALFVDGTLASMKSIAAPIVARSGPFVVARAANEAARFFTGAMDEIAVYGRVLGPGRIAAHFEIAMGR
jgi:hypothetical protein